MSGLITVFWKEFADDFTRQLDFSKLDLTMFHGTDTSDIYPEQLAAIRNQYYDGSWKNFHKAMKKEGRNGEAEIIDKFMTFEQKNKKDIGLVGFKLGYILQLLDDNIETGWN